MALFLVHWKEPDQQKFRQAAAKFAEYARKGSDIDDQPSIKVLSRIHRVPTDVAGPLLESGIDPYHRAAVLHYLLDMD